VAIALHLVGARPVKEGTGRIARFELVPLAELGGRPRIDVLCNMSGIFRDSFQNVVELLDDCFQVGRGGGLFQAADGHVMNSALLHVCAVARRGN
jgi:cobalamin biosynthesis Mg chelatase CobN